MGRQASGIGGSGNQVRALKGTLRQTDKRLIEAPPNTVVLCVTNLSTWRSRQVAQTDVPRHPVRRGVRVTRDLFLPVKWPPASKRLNALPRELQTAILNPLPTSTR